MHKKQKYIYIGVDTHKSSHTAVVIDCWNEILKEITVENKPTAFLELVSAVNELNTGLTPVFGLEDVGGTGRSLAVFLTDNGFITKEVNPALSYAQRMSAPTTKKNDSYDAYCIACVLLSKLDTLPDAQPNDIYWTLSQLVGRRDLLVKHLTVNENQLHGQLKHHYPSYNKFFSAIDGNAALAFWENYPSPHCLANVSIEDFAQILRKASHNACSTKKAKAIIELVQSDGDTKREFQETRDFIVKGIVKEIRFIKEQIKEVEQELKRIMVGMGFKLETMPGIDTVTAANLLSNIGDVNRFSNADKMARFSGIAPVVFSSAGKGKEHKSKQGNRTLHGIFYFLAIQQVQTAKGSGIPRNPSFYEYFNKKIKEGKTKPQALVCVMRVLNNIVYGMLKSKTAYIMPVVPKKEAV